MKKYQNEVRKMVVDIHTKNIENTSNLINHTIDKLIFHLIFSLV
jgi:hypothetical protein